MEVISGIYKIVNRVNGSFYIGASNHIYRRFREHLMIGKRRGCKVLKRALQRHGTENFYLIIIEKCPVCDLVRRELFWIKLLKPRYNISLGPGTLGKKVSDPMKKRLSDAGKKQWAKMTKEQKAKVVNNQLIGPAKGHDVSLETRDKIRLKLAGRKLPSNHCNNISAALKGKPRANKHFNKQVIKIGIDGQEIDRFESIKLAAKSIGINPAGITKQLKGEQKTAGGFLWKLTK